MFPSEAYSPDILYMRFMKDGKVVRVAKFDQSQGLLLALYPSDKPDIFSGEASTRIDDASPRSEVRRDSIKDKIWLKLLDGEPIKKIVKDYEHLSRGQFYLSKRRRETFNGLIRKTFEITEQEERN